MELPHRQRERHRLEILRRYPALETLPTASFGQVVELARRVLGATAAVVHFPARDRLFYASSVEIDEASLYRLCEMVEFGDAAARILTHEDLYRDDRFKDHPLVSGKPGFRFLAAVPLRSPDDLLVGTLCLLDAASRSFTNAECELLLSMGDAAEQELELRRAASESDRLLQEHPYPIWTFDAGTFQVVAGNDAALQFYGLSRDQFLGRSLQDMIAPEDAGAIVENLHRGSGTEQLRSTGHIRQNGEMQYAETLVTPTFQDGRPARQVHVHQSVETQKSDESARQAETFYRRVLEELPVQVSLLDTSGRILFVNDAGVHDPQLRSWVIGKTAAEYDRRRGVSTDVSESRQRHFEAAMRERRPIEFEEMVADADGASRSYVRIVTPVLRTDGSVKYLMNCAVELTRRRRLEEDLQESEQRFRSIVRNVPLGVTLLEPGARASECNPALLKITGYGGDEIGSMDNFLQRITHPEDAGRVLRVYDDVASGGTESEQVETSIVRKDGTSAWVVLFLSLVRDRQRRPGPVMLVVEDVTERRSAEQDLKRSQARHGVLIEKAPDAILVARFRGPLLEVNARACEMTGFSREELLRIPPEELIVDGNLDHDRQIWEELGTGRPIEMERRLLRRDGGALPVELSMKLIDDRLVLVSARDASSRYERAQQLEFQANALSQISEAVVATDILGVLTYINSSAERLLGITAAEAVGRHTSEVIHAHLVGKQHIGEIAELLFRSGHWRGEVVVDVPDNQRLYTEVSVRLARDKNNLPIGTLAVARDITERKEYEHHLIVAKEEAEEMNRLKTAFLANMSHEIRTPLTSIIGFAEVLSEEAAESEREFASLIRNSGRRLMDTLNSVLDLAQLESEALKLDPVPIDVMEPIRETLDLFRAQADDRGLYLEAESDHPGAVMAQLDRVGLSRILINLVSNAVKFTHHGGVRVYVRSEETHVHISVKDTGVGISREFLPHLFDEFKQESSGLSRNYEGSGLGLTITKRLVELMGGAIDVESEKGRGTVFIVTFPR